MLKATKKGIEKLGKDREVVLQNHDLLFIAHMFSEFSNNYVETEEGDYPRRIDR